jgi:hypothetical protein
MKLSRKSIWRNLTEPAATVQGPEHRRRAQLLSTLLVPLILTTFLGTLSAGERQWSMFGALVVLSVTYGLSRTKYYIFAAAISVAALSAPSFVRAITDTDYSPETVASYLLWIALGVVLGGLVFSLRGIALTCAANVGGILLPTALTCPIRTLGNPSVLDYWGLADDAHRLRHFLAVKCLNLTRD